MRTAPLLVAAALLLCGCERGGTSTREVRNAAIEQARQELGLAADTPLEANVWVGPEQHDGQIVMCGTVSDPAADGAAGGRIAPQRFAATGDPIKWLIFERAHDPLVAAQPDKFPDWQRLCGSNGRPD